MAQLPIWKRVTRDQARSVACPTCKAQARQWCFAKGYRDGTVETRPSCHEERLHAAEEAGIARTFALAKPATLRTPRVPTPARPARWAGLEPATMEQKLAEPCPDCGAKSGQQCSKLLPDGTRRLLSYTCTGSRFNAAMERLYPAGSAL